MPEGALALLSDEETPVVISSASVWELSIKHHQGKLPELQHAIVDLPALLRADGFQILSIAISHTLHAGAYSQLHRDPFDRMLAAQAELEQLVLVTPIRNLRPSLAANVGRVDQRAC
tara:strand:- start:49 stop:399 length:351 start_codon:yes stop_codon:yes gene_type:complete